MTVCTASLFYWNYGVGDEVDAGPAFVVASDRMMTDHGLGIEYEASRWKATIVKTTHMLLLAGEFTFLSEALVRLSSHLPEEEKVHASDIAEAMSKAMIEVRNARAEKTYLAPLGLTLETLRESSSALPPSLAERLYEQVQAARYDVEVMVAGVCDKNAGLLRIDDYGVVTNHTDIGFLSIGSGGIHSSAQLMYEPFSHQRHYFKALHSTFLAKKRAEVAPGVGAATDIFRINRDNVVRVPDPIMANLEKVYAAQRAAAAKRTDLAITQLEAADARFIAELEAAGNSK